MMLGDRESRPKLIIGQVAISLEGDVIHPVLGAFVEVVHQRNLLGLPLEYGLHLNVKVALFLKEVDEIALSFVDQVAVDSAFLIDGNEFLLSSAPYKRKI